MRVSVITPSFNQAEFLEETIKSVLALDYPDIEYIIIDGGSTDGSQEIIRKYNGRISKWVSEHDGGQAHAINKGFRMATGNVVAWLNSDDLYFPYAASLAVRRFRSMPNLSVFYGDAAFVDRQGQFRRYFTEVEPFDPHRLRSCTDFIMQPTTFFRRDHLREVGFLDESFHYALDWDLWCRFVRKGFRFHYEREVIAANREYGGTKTLSGGWSRLPEIGRIMQRHRTSLLPNGYWGYLTHELLTRAGGRLLRWAIRIGMLPLNFRNVVWRRRNQRELYGLLPHSSRVGQHCRFVIPAYRQVTSIVLAVQCPWNRPEQEMSLWIGSRLAREHRFAGDTTLQVLHVPLIPGEDRRGYVDVNIGFKHSYSRKKIGADIFHCLLQ